MRRPTPARASEQAPTRRVLPQKPFTIACLIALAISTLYGLYFVWGALFTFWAVNALRTGETFLIEPLTKQDDPILYWILTLAWLGFGLLYLIADLLPG